MLTPVDRLAPEFNPLDPGTPGTGSPGVTGKAISGDPLPGPSPLRGARGGDVVTPAANPAADLLSRLQSRGIRLCLRNNRLAIAPSRDYALLTLEERAQLRHYRADLKNLVRSGQAATTVSTPRSAAPPAAPPVTATSSPLPVPVVDMTPAADGSWTLEQDRAHEERVRLIKLNAPAYEVTMMVEDIHMPGFIHQIYSKDFDPSRHRMA